MAIGDLIAIITAITAILGMLLTSIINYMSTRSNVRTEDKRIKIEEKRTDSDTSVTNVNAATQMLGIGLQQTTFLQTYYNDCMNAKRVLEQDNESLKLIRIQRKVAITKIVGELRILVDEALDYAKDHPNVPPIMLQNIQEIENAIIELEQEGQK